MSTKSNTENNNLNFQFIRNSSIRTKKGITLIALVITIVILLVLSGVVIATLTGNNGLFARAKQAKVAQTKSDMKESLNLAIQELQVEKLAGATLDDITQEWLTQKLSEYDPILKENVTTNSKKVTLQKNGIIKTYMIDSNLSITEVENESGIDFSYEIKSRNNGIAQILIKIRDNENGIDRVECVNGNVIQCYGTREEKGIDQEIEVGTEYKFKVISVSGKEREETILIEPEIIVGEAYIGTSTTNTNASNSVANNSQTRGTTLYINFTATLEKFGTECAVKLKDGTDSDILPYAITKNGTYTFVITGTYGDGKIIIKEVEVKVAKYTSAVNLVKYDAGDWTEAEIQKLKLQNLYMINKEKTINAVFNLNDSEGLNFTFGGFTYKGDETNEKYIKDGRIITSRNESVATQSGFGTPAYDGWQILEIKDSTGKIIKNYDEINTIIDNAKNEKIYVTKLIHAGSPENFVYYYTTPNDTNRAEYLLSSGIRKTEYNILNSGEEINKRYWDMYKDIKLDKDGYINNVHIMTYEEAYEITGNNNNTSGIRNIDANYWLASANRE
ncbi:unknown [Clostridium sp. CAG:575]|nr:unknown [Clostridium sp. CAG:575]